jgi:hypothetical protein
MSEVKALGVLFASAAMASASVPMVYAQGEGGGGVYGGGSVGATRMRAGIAPRKAGTAEARPGMMWAIVRSAGSDNTVDSERASLEHGRRWREHGQGRGEARRQPRPSRRSRVTGRPALSRACVTRAALWT